MIFQTEKQLKEYGEKIPAEKKEVIESALTELKEAHKAQDIAQIDASTQKMNDAWQAASQDMYQATQDAEANGAAPEEGTEDGGTSSSDDSEDVTDVEFEEVDDKKE